MTGLLISSIAFKPYPYSEYRLYIIFLKQSRFIIMGKAFVYNCENTAPLSPQIRHSPL